MTGNPLTRRHFLGVLGATGAVVALPACGSSVGNDSGGGNGNGGTIKVGLIIPQAGVYAPLGTDMRRAWDLWLAQHDKKLGDLTVETVVRDEGEDPQTGVPAVQRLIQNDQCDVLVGIVNSATALGVRDMVDEAKKVLLITNAGAEDITKSGSSPYIWRTSFTNGQVSAALGKHLGESADYNGVYVIAPDYAAGEEAVAGFEKAFKAAGGKIAGSSKTPFGKTQDYQPFLSRIRQSGAEATFCFYAGSEAVTFVKQYRQFGLAKEIPLYGSGFLTEGGVLDAQAAAAVGVRTSLHYTSELDNPANQEFVRAYEKKYGTAPTVYSVQTWDAANVLHRALSENGDLNGDTLSKTLGNLGEIDDSPRGGWSFDNQTPKQQFYLREVEKADGGYVNTVRAELGEQEQPS